MARVTRHRARRELSMSAPRQRRQQREGSSNFFHAITMVPEARFIRKACQRRRQASRCYFADSEVVAFRYKEVLSPNGGFDYLTLTR